MKTTFNIQGSLSRPPSTLAEPRVPPTDPYLMQVIAQLEGIVAERAPQIAKLEEERAFAVAAHESVVAEVTSAVDKIREDRDASGRSEEASLCAADMAIHDAEKLASERLAEAAAFASAVRRTAAEEAERHREVAKQKHLECVAAALRFTEAKQLLAEKQRALDTAGAPYDEQLAKLRRGRYGEATKRLPELRERLAKREQERAEALAKVEEFRRRQVEDEEKSKQSRDQEKVTLPFTLGAETP